MMDGRARVEKTVIYPVGRDEVWAALSQPEELSRWFGMEVLRLELWAAGRIVFRGEDGEQRRALIETVEAPERLAFRWLPVPGHGPQPATRVELVLEDVAGGTALTVVEEPWLAVGEIIPMPGPIFMGRGPGDLAGGPPRVLARGLRRAAEPKAERRSMALVGVAAR
jgi:uncharacterized protein YndB with AHSA1/START domain